MQMLGRSRQTLESVASWAPTVRAVMLPLTLNAIKGLSTAKGRFRVFGPSPYIYRANFGFAFFFHDFTEYGKSGKIPCRRSIKLLLFIQGTVQEITHNG